MNPRRTFFLARNVRHLAVAGLALFLMFVAGSVMAATSGVRIELQMGQSYSSSTGTQTVFVEGVFAERSIGSSRFIVANK